MNSFNVTYRNYGHWDISTRERGRVFAIRGGPGSYYIRDSRTSEHKTIDGFKTVQACMAYISDTLMFELIAAEGQEVTRIEDWNIR